MKLISITTMRQSARLGFAAAAVVALAACTSAPKGPSEAELNAQAGLTVQQVGKDVKIAVTNQFLFETGKFDLKPESLEAIKRTATLINRTKSLVMVEGHTDNQGTKELNQKLSEDRALAVKNALINAGVDLARVGSIGYGLNAPIASNDTEQGRSQNRRTEIVVLDTPAQALMTVPKDAKK